MALFLQYFVYTIGFNFLELAGDEFPNTFLIASPLFIFDPAGYLAPWIITMLAVH
jgi:hypothetical protein